MDWMTWIAHHPVAHAAASGALSAALIDIAAFRKWQSWHDAAEYQWGLASWRWFQGGFYGAMAGWGLAVVAP